jgi:hypothetical protein
VNDALAGGVDDGSQLGVSEVSSRPAVASQICRLASDPVKPVAGGRGRAGARRPDGVDADDLEDLRTEPFDRGGEQAALASEAKVQRASGDPGVRRYLTGRNGLVAALGEQSARCLEAVLASGVSVSGGGWPTPAGDC